MSSNIFGDILTGKDVEDAVVVALQLWATTYIAEMERQNAQAPQTYPLPKSWQVAQEFEKWPEAIVPSVIVVSPGTNGEPLKRGDGSYEAPWSVGVGIVVEAKDRNSTHALAMIYSAAFRTILLQHQSLGGLASAISWIGEAYDDVASEDARTLQAAMINFTVYVPNVVQSRTGPLVVPVAPYVNPGNWPLVSANPADRIVDITKEV